MQLANALLANRAVNTPRSQRGQSSAIKPISLCSWLILEVVEARDMDKSVVRQKQTECVPVGENKESSQAEQKLAELLVLLDTDVQDEISGSKSNTGEHQRAARLAVSQSISV
eukprot:Filipodium_phascolosomae@DN480_c0_g1_i1.p2